MLILLGFGAYGTVAHDYIWSGDDYNFDLIINPDSILHPREQGVWRILSQWLMSMGLHTSPPLYLLTVVLLHTVNAFLIHRILRQVGASASWALAGAAAFVVAPGFHEALAWISGTNVVFSATFFLLALSLAVGTADAGPHEGPRALALVTCTILGNLCNEQLLGAYAALPLLAWWLQGRDAFAIDLRRHWRRLAPWLGCALFLAAYFLTLSEHTTKQPAPSIRAAFSPLYYQLYNLWVFTIWTEGLWLREWARSLLTLAGAVSAALLAGGAWLWFRTRVDTARASARLIWRRAAAAWLLALVSAAAIYGAAGGYSLDSRKRYVFVVLGCLAVAHLASQFATAWRRPLRLAFVALLLVSGATAALFTVARREMMRAVDQYRVEINRHAWPEPVLIRDWHASPTDFERYVWAGMWAEMLGYRRPGELTDTGTLDASAARTVVRYDWTHRRWERLP